jgi:succinyl-CoA synthetase beta subunit
VGLRSWHVRAALEGSNLGEHEIDAIADAAKRMYTLFLECQADLIELNPIVIAAESATAVDVRIVVAGDPFERSGDRSRASSGYDLVELDPSGNVGLITTGAGASLLLIDLLGESGARPINFCDIRTGSLRGSAERLRQVLQALSVYENLRCIAINVFAGITDLRELSELIVESIELESPGVPVIARLEGAFAAEARARLRQASIQTVDSLDSLLETVAAATMRAPE